jgi:hypothetical protein
MATSTATTNHRTIQRWVEERDGHPAYVKATEGKGGGGLLRIDFGEQEDSLDRIGWDEFFKTFEESNLAFLYQDHTASGDTSRFAKFVDRDGVEVSADADEDENADEDADEDEDADDDLDDDELDDDEDDDDDEVDDTDDEETGR